MTADWLRDPPALRAPSATLREPRAADAPALLARLTTPPVVEYMAQPPSSLPGFERFIDWARRARSLGRLVCLVAVPDGQAEPVGLLQLRRSERSPGSAEWGVAFAEDRWGTGLYLACAQTLVDFAFRGLGLRRLEARVSVDNVRANGSLRKLGAVCEGTMPQPFSNGLHRSDQWLWVLDADRWLAAHPDRFSGLPASPRSDRVPSRRDAPSEPPPPRLARGVR